MEAGVRNSEGNEAQRGTKFGGFDSFLPAVTISRTSSSAGSTLAYLDMLVIANLKI